MQWCILATALRQVIPRLDTHGYPSRSFSHIMVGTLTLCIVQVSIDQVQCGILCYIVLSDANLRFVDIETAQGRTYSPEAD